MNTVAERPQSLATFSRRHAHGMAAPSVVHGGLGLGEFHFLSAVIRSQCRTPLVGADDVERAKHSARPRFYTAPPTAAYVV